MAWKIHFDIKIREMVAPVIFFPAEIFHFSCNGNKSCDVRHRHCNTASLVVNILKTWHILKLFCVILK